MKKSHLRKCSRQTYLKPEIVTVTVNCANRILDPTCSILYEDQDKDDIWEAW